MRSRLARCWIRSMVGWPRSPLMALMTRMTFTPTLPSVTLMHRRDEPQGLAESLRLQQARQGYVRSASAHDQGANQPTESRRVRTSAGERHPDRASIAEMIWNSPG
jgi:hypothetical protein